jgi:hypothetical protein
MFIPASLCQDVCEMNAHFRNSKKKRKFSAEMVPAVLAMTGKKKCPPCRQGPLVSSTSSQMAVKPLGNVGGKDADLAVAALGSISTASEQERGSHGNCSAPLVSEDTTICVCLSLLCRMVSYLHIAYAHLLQILNNL